MLVKLKYVLSNRNFCKLWIAQTQSHLGSMINIVALSLYVYKLTGSGFAVGKLEISMILPSIIVGLFAGAIVDRSNRKLIMISSDILRGVLFLLLPWVPSLFYFYVIVFLSSLIGLFFSPAFSASIPQIVDKQRLLVANSVAETTGQAVRMIGPAIGGVLFAFAGFKLVCILNAITFFVSATLIGSAIIPRAQISERITSVKEILNDVINGLQSVKKDRFLFTIVLIYSAIQLGTGAIVVLIVVFIKQVLNGSDAMYGTIISVVAAGSIIGAILIGLRGNRDEIGIVKYALTLLGIIIMGIAINTNTSFALCLFFFVGVCQSILSITVVTLLQKYVANELLGRVFATMGVLIQCAQLLSMGVGSALCDVYSVKIIYIAGATITLITAMIGAKYLSAPEITTDEVPTVSM